MREYSVYDSNVSIDAGWIESTNNIKTEHSELRSPFRDRLISEDYYRLRTS